LNELSSLYQRWNLQEPTCLTPANKWKGYGQLLQPDMFIAEVPSSQTQTFLESEVPQTCTQTSPEPEFESSQITVIANEDKTDDDFPGREKFQVEKIKMR
jgi:hypothetical protein